MPPRVDTSSVDSELSVKDFAKQPRPNTDEEERLIKLVMDRYNDAATMRRPHEGVWFESLAFFLGNQHVAWYPGNGASPGMLRPVRDPRRPHRRYATRNKIRPKMKKLLARATSRKIDAEARPATDSQLDIAAYWESTAVLNWFDHKFRRNAQNKRLILYALVTSTVWLKVYYDPTREAEVPRYDASGQLIGMTTARRGDICEDIVPCFEGYVDPRAHTHDEAAWFIHAKVRSVEDVQQRYPEGWMVQPDMGAGPAGYIESRLASVVGDYQRGAEPGQGNKSVLILEMWEKPTVAFPQGRLITVGGGRVLRNDPWPYSKRDDFPFIPLSFEEGLSTYFGTNATQDLISPQRSYNHAISRIEEHLQTSWGKILAPEGCTIGPTAFDSATPNEVIYYRPGPGVPQHIPAPEMPAFLVEILKINDNDMNDIAGVHEVSNGQLPAADLPAAAIRLLQDADTTQIADFTDNIEEFNHRRATWEIALAAQFFREPRLAAMVQQTGGKGTNAQISPMQAGPMGAPSPSAPPSVAPGGPTPAQPAVGVGQAPAGPGSVPASPNPASIAASQASVPTPALQVMSFRALNAGGQVRVFVEPGSATPKSAEAQSQEIMDLYKAGLFGPVGDPTTAGIVLRLLDISGGDQIVQQMEVARFKAAMLVMATQPNPAQVAQVNANKELLAQQADQAHQAAIGHAKAETEAALAAAKHQYDLEAKNIDFQHDLALQDANARQPSVSISVKADPEGTVSAEEQAGLAAGSPEAIRAMNTLKPQTAGGKGQPTNGKA